MSVLFSYLMDGFLMLKLSDVRRTSIDYISLTYRYFICFLYRNIRIKDHIRLDFLSICGIYVNFLFGFGV